MHFFHIELYDYGRGLMTSSLVLLMMEELKNVIKEWIFLSNDYKKVSMFQFLTQSKGEQTRASN